MIKTLALYANYTDTYKCFMCGDYVHQTPNCRTNGEFAV